VELTSEQIQEAVLAIKDGMPRMRALKSAGITPARYRKLVKLAADGEVPYPSFLRSLDAAESAAQKAHIEQIAASPDWKAHAFILERQYPQEWGQKIQLEVKRELEKVFAIAQEVLPEEQFVQLLERVSRLDSEASVNENEEAVALH